MIVAAIAAAIFFGSVAFIGLQVSRIVCTGIAPADDGPPPGRAPAPVLVVGATLIGAALVLLHASPEQIGIGAIVTFALVACWFSDALCGIVPDYFTLVPLAALLFFALARRDWGTIVSAAIVFVPFAGAALFSRGYGMGWGDAKLVALAGAALGGESDPDLIFRKSTTFKLLTPNDKLAVYGIDDPVVEGVACHYTASEKGGLAGAFGLAEQTSDISLACRQYGPITFKAKFEQGEVVFSERRSLIFKKMQIVRGCDVKRNILVYMTYSDKLIEGSPKNSTSTVPIEPWGAAAPVPKCSDYLR